MFKSTLGLGLGSTKKADLTAYLKNLEKKNKEVQRKHSLTGIEDVAKEVEKKEEKDDSSQEDSDLLSLAREMQEDQYESPFIKRRTEQKTAGATRDGRVPEESEVNTQFTNINSFSYHRSLSFPPWPHLHLPPGWGRSSLS